MIDLQASDGASDGASENAQNPSADDFINIISRYIDSLSAQLRHISLEIHDNPETRYKEIYAHELLTTFIGEQGDQDWKVTPSAYGIGTAFVAVFDSGKEGPVVSFNAEYGKGTCLLCVTCADAEADQEQ